MNSEIITEDVKNILGLTGGLWEQLREQSIFITGGTGFFGRWLLETFVAANQEFNLNLSVLALTRAPDKFIQTAPHLGSNPAIKFYKGDIRNFTFPEGKFNYIIHAAADFDHTTSAELIFETMVEGTKHTLDFAKQCEAKKFLYVSSGAVYGKQPESIKNMAEDYQGQPDPGDAYGLGKQAAEKLCADYSKKYQFEIKIARCFSFVGPLKPLGSHYAIGNFIGDGLKGGPIEVKGDGTPKRSYLYTSDLVVWLLTILLKGRLGRAYNVGSEQAISIKDLAEKVAENFNPKPKIIISQKPVENSKNQSFVPSTQRALTELGLMQTVSLDEAIKRTVKYYSKKNRGNL